MPKLAFSPNKISQNNISELHSALKKVNLHIADEEIRSRDMGESTVDAIKDIQKKNKLAVTGKLNAKTLNALNAELFDVHHTLSKTRTEKLHALLEKTGLAVAEDEMRSRTVGDTSRKAIESFQKKAGLPIDGKITEAFLDKLHEEVIKKTYSTKTQIGNLQNTILRAAKIANVPVEISEEELKNKTIGATTSAAIKELQNKYKLPQTGQLDRVTLDKIQSIAVSRGTRKTLLEKVKPRDLTIVTKVLRLNMVSPKVAELQKAMAYMGYSINEKESKTQAFGKTTRAAVLAFQQKNGLPETGHADRRTFKLINQEIEKANPAARAAQFKYRVRGSVRDDLWNRKNKMVIKVFEKTLEGEKLLAASKNFLNGFFDITYDPPVDPASGKVKDPFHLVIRLYEPIDNNPANDKPIVAPAPQELTRYIVSRILWVNFTLGTDKYKGDSEYAILLESLRKPLGATRPEDVSETQQNRQITYLSQQTGLTTDDIMRIVLSHRAAKQINRLDIVDGETCFAFISQNLPAGLPGDLLRSTDNWTTIDQLTENAASGIVFTDDDLLKQVLENALSQNLVSRNVNQRKDAILQVLKDKRTGFTLQKPILVGNGNLKSLLDASTMAPENQSLIAETFIASKGINNQFWDELDKKAAIIGGDNLKDLKTTIDLGNITKNHIPALDLFKQNTGEGKMFNQASDVAKKSLSDLVNMLKPDPATLVPANIPGANVNEKVTNYARAIQTRAEAIFPGVALVANVQRVGKKPENIDTVEQIIDQYPTFDLKQDNADKFFNEKKDELIAKGINLTAAVKSDFKLVQRANKLSNTAASGAALVDLGLHSSMQIYFAGKDNLKKRFVDKGLDEKLADRIYETAKMQYTQIWARLLQFKPEMNSGTPAAIIPQTYTKDEIKEWLGDIPDLELLFGSLDYCDCKDCKSLFGPAAYLADLLRFLNEHLAVDPNKTVQAVLLERRPDLANIKLNCENTNTHLPYIDLVCEILENYIAAGNLNFSYQTTLTAQELRAMPEYVRAEAYNMLSAVDYPMSPVFNLWQEETRTNLAYLRTPRQEVMELFRDISDTTNKRPSNASIGAEYFGISSHETDLIVTTRETETEQDKYWGFSNENWAFLDAGKTQVPVKNMIDRTKLTYYQLLELLQVRFVNGNPDDAHRSDVVRPPDTCDTAVQYVNNLTWRKFDRMHRFIRLWRKTGLEMCELDLLIRNPKIGNNQIDGETIANLKRFRQLQEKLSLPFEILLAFYSNINGEEHAKPDKPEVKIQSLYLQLFQNKTITNPLDDYFKIKDTLKLKSIENIHLIDETLPLDPPVGYSPVPTILSALAIKRSDFDSIKEKTDNHLSLSSLSALLRYTYLARGLKLTIKDLILLSSINNVADPFSSVQTTFDFITDLEAISASGLTLRELDYILNFNEDSPAGLRSEVYLQLLESIRKNLITANDNISKLHLTQAEQQQILDIDAGGLATKTDGEIKAAGVPLATLLTNKREIFMDAGIPTADIDYIVHFDFNGVLFDPADKAHLLHFIQQLQINLGDFLQQGINSVRSLIASSFSITDEQSKLLLNQLKLNSKALVDILTDPKLLKKDAAGIEYLTIDNTNYPDQFSALLLLHKASLLVQRMNIEFKDLKWFIGNSASVHALDLSSLPLSKVVGPNRYAEWLNLNKFLSFKAAFPEPDNASLRSVLDKAIAAPSAEDVNITKELLTDLANLTQWNLNDLTIIHSGFNLQHAKAQHGTPAHGDSDYVYAELYKRLQKCFDQIKLTGVSAAIMFAWADRETAGAQQNISLQTRQAIKSKYENDAWLDKITPLQNDMREKKRQALVNYSIENSMRGQKETIVSGGKKIPNPLFWKDSIALYKYFLIDVEMNSCQLTSRIKQAISSVQMFVQRCFLNLENRYVQVTQEQKEDASSPNAWSQWKWMKNYRIWEANRKVFFYPENWIEPELRDDKSPFFKELENEIMQNEITAKNVEAAFLNYLHKVDEVAHLEVCGLYHEMEDLDPSEIGYERNIVHVIGRTKSIIPHIYYYRQYDMNYETWSAWEKIDVDITGDHVVPVMFNRKLHLFWLVTQQKPMKVHKNPPAQPTSGPTDTPEPAKYFEIQLGWSVKKHNGWSPKKVSKQKLIHPWERPLFSYNLRPYYYVAENQLYLDVYLSTSKEFNATLFYDQFTNQNTKQTANPFNETFKPWHSSSFLFDGEVKGIELKRLFRQYTVDSGKIDNNSFDYVHDKFGEDSINITQMIPVQFGPRLSLPDGMHYYYNQLTNNSQDAPNPNRLNVLEKATTTGQASTAMLLSNAPSPFTVVITQQDKQFNASDHPFFYQDNDRAFFIKPEWSQILNNYNQVIGTNKYYHFSPFYHPYTVLFIRELNRTGIEGLLNRNIQLAPGTFVPKNMFDFSRYQPKTSVAIDKDTKGNSISNDIVDFSLGGAYSIYDWELFFHAPLMIACSLSQNQCFEEAMQWFHYIFDPTNIDNLPTPQRYWITKPFHEYNSDDYRKQRIENILSNIDLPEYQGQLKAWKNNPFEPHLIARFRPVAYQKTIVMKYLDNLIAWGDMLFRRDTIEAINEAALLYMLAYEILGRRPIKVPSVEHDDYTYKELEQKIIDRMANARVDVVIEDTLLPIKVEPSISGTEPMPKLDTLYFCIPVNDKLFSYWDTVEDRLFKIRNCMNIEGIVRQLPLFDPPIDPALLVKAAAAGIDLGSVLNDITAGTPPYRFRVVVQKAIEFCNEVRSLGEKLLNALEKKDAESLALFRSQHEIQLLQAIKEIRKKQIDEAVETLGSLQKAQEMATQKKNYYEGRDYMNAWEIAGVALNGVSLGIDISVSIGYIYAGVLKAIPKFIVGAAGFGGSPTGQVSIGGDHWGDAAKFAVEGLSQISRTLEKMATLSNTLGSYQRRKEEWDFQAGLATTEIDQLLFQINAAEIRQAIAEKELDNQDLQIDNAKTIDEYMRSKYTNDQLYNWMITQIATVYFQAYRLAYDMAKKAEKCYQRELGLEDTSFIQFGYWDSLKKGLLSGDKLVTDLRRLEAAYIDNNKRELEIIKHISLAQIAPMALMLLKETGKCDLSLPEWLFDMDFPGHYMRRIKNVSISIPCVSGPYTGVNCTLSLVRSQVRKDPDPIHPYNDAQRFRVQYGSISSIATSHAQNDNGMFELNFNDERYLPFEGEGVISDWQISMPRETNYFDFATISDVLLHINYTARNGGSLLATLSYNELQKVLPASCARLFSLKHEFPTEWYQFFNPSGGAEQELVITLKPEHYPFFMRGKLSIAMLKKLDIFVESSQDKAFVSNKIKIVNIDLVADPTKPVTIAVDSSYEDAIYTKAGSNNTVYHLDSSSVADKPLNGGANPLGELRLKLKLDGAGDYKSLRDDQIDNLFFLFQMG